MSVTGAGRDREERDRERESERELESDRESASERESARELERESERERERDRERERESASERDIEGGSESDRESDREREIEGGSESDRESASERDSDRDRERDRERERERESASERDIEGDRESDREGEIEGGSESDRESASERDSDADRERESASERDIEGGSESDRESELEGESEGGSESEREGESESDSGDGKSDRERRSSETSVRAFGNITEPQVASYVEKQGLAQVHRLLTHGEVPAAGLVSGMFGDCLRVDDDKTLLACNEAGLWEPADERALSVVADAAVTLEEWMRKEAHAVGKVASDTCEGSMYSEAAAGARRLLQDVSSLRNVLDATLLQLRKVPDKKWDAVPHLLSVRTGVVDLRTTKLRDRRLDDYMRLCGGAYDAKANTEPISDLVLDIMGGDRAKADFLQLSAGMLATGETGDQPVIVLTGARSSGVGQFVDMLQGAMGTYAETTRGGAGTGTPAPALMHVRGHPLLVDTGDGLLKSLTQITRGSTKFTLCRCLQVLQDTEPEASRVSAFWERALVIEFPDGPDGPDGLPEFRKDPSKMRALTDNGTGFLKWLVEGAHRYYDVGLARGSWPDYVKDAVAARRAASDPFKAWFDERVVADAGSYMTYDQGIASFHEVTGKQLTQAQFGADMKRCGAEPTQRRLDRGRARVFSGFTLRE